MPEPSAPLLPNRHPPFTALRAVEAAVRNRSYSAAARELQITHAAISQAIKRLELEFGLKLFERNGQAMEPSAIAVRMAQAYSEARNSIYRSLGDIIERPATIRAVVSMPSDFGRFWFAPRIDALARDLPGLTIEVRTGLSDSAADGSVEEGADIRIGMDPVDQPGWTSERIAQIVLFPVCSPDFHARHGGMRLRHLPDLPLLAEKRWSWQTWLHGAGLKRSRVSHDFLFDDANVALDAAVRGHGVALAHIFHVEEQLRRGILIAPLRETVTTADSLYLSWRSPGDARMARLATWLRRALQTSGATVRTFLPTR